VTKQLDVGAVGYLYDQLSCDGGPGNRVGCFESHVAGIGPQIGYVIPMGDLQGYVNLKGYKAFDASHRANRWDRYTGTAKGNSNKCCGALFRTPLCVGRIATPVAVHSGDLASDNDPQKDCLRKLCAIRSSRVSEFPRSAARRRRTQAAFRSAVWTAVSDAANCPNRARRPISLKC
jgi:hypothetical protein